MKKNLYIANLLVAGLMTFTGCDGMVLNQIMPIKPDIRLNFRNMIFRNMC